MKPRPITETEKRECEELAASMRERGLPNPTLYYRFKGDYYTVAAVNPNDPPEQNCSDAVKIRKL